MNPRTFLAGVAAALACSLAGAQAFPSRPITIVIGSSPGSTTDGLARGMAQEIAKETGQPVLVDNKAGAAGGIAAQAVARAAPDGYTVFMTTNSTQAANPHFFKKLIYDPVKDFAPVSALVKGILVMVVHPDVKAGTVTEFIALAKKEPGKMSFAEGSSSARVAAELFKQMTGTQMVHIPYKANPPAMLDLLGGRVDLMIVDLTVSMPHVRAGRLRALGVSSPMRSPLVPDLPTLAEAGVPGYEMSYWNALYAPAGTPEPIVRRLNELFQKALTAEFVRKFITQNGMEPFTSTPAELAAFQASEVQRWGRIIKAAGIEPE